MISRSHSNDPELQGTLSNWANTRPPPIGSSLKFCLVAEGQASSIRASGRPAHRDTAAGHAVAVAAGSACSRLAGKTLGYTPRGILPQPPASGSLFIKQFMQQVDHLLHLSC
ncbi:hypothetical protein MJ575_03255 [Klebsiella pneumoniae]|nr:hypothetical protein MJ575_03255 [Klebsiella pneumoniae]